MSTKIQADTINGIYKVDDFDSNFDSLTSESILISCLKDQADDEIIYAEVGNEMLAKLNEIFGVH